MVQARPRFTSFEQYLDTDPSELPEGRYELVNGEIIEMGAENDQNVEIAGFLYTVLLQFFPHYLIRRGSEVAVNSEAVTSRLPDLVVITKEARAQLRKDKPSLIGLDLPAPRLVIEVVSPGEASSENYKRDYIEKRQEYARRGIQEYWIVDPNRQIVLILSLKNGTYHEQPYRGGKLVKSQVLQTLNLTAAQILEPED